MLPGFIKEEGLLNYVPEETKQIRQEAQKELQSIIKFLKEMQPGLNDPLFVKEGDLIKRVIIEVINISCKKISEQRFTQKDLLEGGQIRICIKDHQEEADRFKHCFGRQTELALKKAQKTILAAEKTCPGTLAKMFFSITSLKNTYCDKSIKQHKETLKETDKRIKTLDKWRKPFFHNYDERSVARSEFMCDQTIELLLKQLECLREDTKIEINDLKQRAKEQRHSRREPYLALSDTIGKYSKEKTGTEQIEWMAAAAALYSRREITAKMLQDSKLPGKGKRK